MRTLAMCVVVVLLVGVLAGCAGGVWAPVIPPGAWVYTNTKAPLDVDVENTVIGKRHGEASTMNVLGLVAWGDGSVRAAARDGNITKVQHLDYQQLSVLGVFSRYTTIVYGE